MIIAQFKDRGYLTLSNVLAHQRRISARAERQGKSVQKYGFTRTRLARHHGQSRAELKVQPVDQNDVADAQGGQHVAP